MTAQIRETDAVTGRHGTLGVIGAAALVAGSRVGFPLGAAALLYLWPRRR